MTSGLSAAFLSRRRASIGAGSLTIRQKQLLTLGSAVGILACGACFGPVHYTPPPPPPIATEGVKSVRIVVVNASDSRHLDSDALAGVIVSNLNARSGYLKVRAHLRENSDPEEDAVLEVKILSETASPEPAQSQGDRQSWTFQVHTSTSLTRRNGALVWRSVDVVSTFQFDSYAHDTEQMWKDPIIQSRVLTGLGNRVLDQVVYQPPKASAMSDSH